MKRFYEFTNDEGRTDFIRNLKKFFLGEDGISIRRKRIITRLNAQSKATATLCVTRGSLLEILSWENPKEDKQFLLEIET